MHHTEEARVAPEGVMTATASSGFTFTVNPRPSAYDAKLFRLSDIRGFTQHLTGRLKTLIDGTTADATQRKALKDLIHEMTWTEHYQAVAVWADWTVNHEPESGTLNNPPFSSASSSSVPE